MKVFLFGSHWKNAGPDNVNQELIDVSDGDFYYLRSTNKFLRRFETIVAIKKCNVILLSGLCSPQYFRIITMSKKKLVYLMHGDRCFEDKVNNQNASKAMLEVQDQVFRYASKIVCVSQKYSDWVSKRYPEFASKITYVNNGMTIKRRPRTEKEPYSIAIAGGNRPIKANKYVCEAVNLLRKEGIFCKVYVFGRHYPNCEELPETENMEYMGHMDEVDYYHHLDRISIFVMNSDIESFGLTVADAINCNCSLLVSKNVGAISILGVADNDIIQENHNPEEIAKKIIQVENDPNTDRIFHSIDLKSISSENAYKRLISICEGVE